MGLVDSIRERLLVLENARSNPDVSFDSAPVLRDVERDVLLCGSSEFDARLKALDSTWPERALLKQTMDYYLEVLSVEDSLTALNASERVYFRARVERLKGDSSDFIDRLRLIAPDQVDAVRALFDHRPVYSIETAGVVWNETGFGELSDFYGSARSIGSHLDFLERHKNHRFFPVALSLVRSRVELLRESSLQDKVAEYSSRLSQLE